MRNNGNWQAAYAQGARLGTAQGSKFVTTDYGCGDTALFQFDGVVDTPRRTRPSITDRGHHRVALGEPGHDCFRCSHSRVLVAFDHRELATAGV